MYEHSQQPSFLTLAARHWKIGLFLICGCAGLATVATFALPVAYDSEMKFLVKNERADLILTPDKNITSQMPTEVSENQVNSEVELLKSRDLLEKVVAENHLNLPYEKNRKVQIPTSAAMAAGVRKLSKDLKITVLRKTNIIQVSYRNSDPDISVSVLRELGDQYLTAHLAAHSSPGSYQFFTDQVDKYNHQLLLINTTISEFHRRKQLYSMPEQQSAVLAALQGTDSLLRETDTKLAEEHGKLAAAERSLEEIPERVVTQVRSVPNQQAIQQLQASLTDLRNRRISLVIKFKPTDRLVIDLDRQIANTEADLETIKTHAAEEKTTDLNSVRQNLDADYLHGEVAVEGLHRQRAELAHLRGDYLNQLSSLDTNNLDLQKLEQYRKEAQDNYDLYVRRLGEARMADSLDREKFSNVVIIERPSASPEAFAPKLMANSVSGVAIGICLYLACTYFLELRGERKSANASSMDLPRYSERAFHATNGD